MVSILSLSLISLVHIAGRLAAALQLLQARAAAVAAGAEQPRHAAPDADAAEQRRDGQLATHRQLWQRGVSSV